MQRRQESGENNTGKRRSAGKSRGRTRGCSRAWERGRDGTRKWRRSAGEWRWNAKRQRSGDGTQRSRRSAKGSGRNLEAAERREGSGRNLVATEREKNRDGTGESQASVETRTRSKRRDHNNIKSVELCTCQLTYIRKMDGMMVRRSSVEFLRWRMRNGAEERGYMWRKSRVNAKKGNKVMKESMQEERGNTANTR